MKIGFVILDWLFTIILGSVLFIIGISAFGESSLFHPSMWFLSCLVSGALSIPAVITFSISAWYQTKNKNYVQKNMILTHVVVGAVYLLVGCFICIIENNSEMWQIIPAVALTYFPVGIFFCWRRGFKIKGSMDVIEDVIDSELV